MLVKDKVYLYSLWSGAFRVYEGEIHQSTYHNGVVAFSTKIKNVHCSPQPGVIYNAVVWFPERNDDLARKILIEYEENQIALLEEKILNYRIKIQKLKGEIIS